MLELLDLSPAEDPAPSAAPLHDSKLSDPSWGTP